MGAVLHARRARLGVARAARRAARPRTPARAVALAAAGRAVQQVGVRRAARRERRAEDGARRGDGRRGPARARIAGAAVAASVARRARGRLITVEGIDGAGKTTLVDGAGARAARARPRRSRCCASRAASSCPSASGRWSRTRAWTSTRARRRCSTRPRARSSSPSSSLPRLAAGDWVLLDRFVDSSLAYQGGGRALGVAEVAAINDFATGRPAPDRTLLLRIDPRRRARARRRPRRGGRPARARGRRLLRRDGRGLRRARRRRARRVAVHRRRRGPPEGVLADALAALAPLPSVGVAVRVRLVPRPGVGDHRPRARAAAAPSRARARDLARWPRRAPADRRRGAAPRATGISRPVTRRAASITSPHGEAVAGAEVVDRGAARR